MFSVSIKILIIYVRELSTEICCKFIIVFARGPRKRPKMVGIGKSGFDSASYAEFSQEHDQHLTLDVWWPNHE